MSVYPEKKRDGVTHTGRWVGAIQVKKHLFKRVFDSHAEAQGYVAYVEASGQEPPHAAKLGDGPTFTEVLAEAKAHGGRKGKWKADRDHSLMQRLEFCDSLLGNLPVASIGARELRSVVEALQKRPVRSDHTRERSPATINRYLRAASAVLTFASQQGYIAKLPAIPTLEEGPGREEIVTEDQEKVICKILGERGFHAEAYCVRVLCATGMRAGELMKLQPAQIGNDYIALKGTQTKNNRPRRVIIDTEMARNLRAMVASGGLPTHHNLLMRFKAAVKAAEYSDELVLHSLRHTHATRLLKSKKFDPITIRDRMGWSSVSMLDRYGHSDDDAQREGMRNMHSAAEHSAENGTVVLLQDRQKA